jgi:DNA replication licensing factor MCM3
MLKLHKSRLIVNVNDIRQFNRDLANLLLQQPIDYLPTFEKALKEVVQELNEPIFGFDILGVRFHVGLEGSFGELHTNPRHLSSRLLSHMVCLDGIVTSCSLVRPKLLKSVHYSESMKTFLVKEYWDATMLNGMQLPGSTSYPTEGDDKQKLTSEFGLSQYRDYQTISIQEMPEKAPAGQLPRSIDVIVDDDLVDKVKPGDRAQIVGVYKSLATAYNGQVPSTFRAVMVANNVRQLNRDAVAPQLSSADIQQIRSLSRRSDIFELISRSLAPSIYGHEYVKKAVALMLLGGVERNISNSNTSETTAASSDGLSTSTHIRGDINLMLVGDPSTAKSQMLRFVLGIAPLAIATTGRGSSGVGLTAAVTSDKETGERRLEAGAMVLADRGIVCIDEFDKMSDNDRVAIHEVMEQQTVTIAKAGIHASLNARCSVLAAANPIWGQYRETASPQENIRLPDSLLSRFDLLFIILDKNTPEHDRHISHHVLKMHRYVPPGLPEGAPIPESVLFDSEDEDETDNNNGADSAGNDTASIFQRRYNSSQEQSDEMEDDSEEADQQLLTIQFIKKYLHYARTSCKPVLTKAAAELIVAAYSEFRQKKVQDDMTASSDGGIVTSTAKTFPVTPRTLETLIRLATAHAKARLSNKVEKKDARVAQEMIEFCLYQEVKKKPTKRTKKVVEESDAEESSEDDDDGEEQFDEKAPITSETNKDSKTDTSIAKTKTKTSKTKSPAAASNEKDIWDPELEEIATKLSQASSLTAQRKKFSHPEEVSQQLPIADSQPSSLPVVSADSQSQSQTQEPILTGEEIARLRDLVHSSLSRLNQTGETSIEYPAFLAELKKSDVSIMVVAQESHVNEILKEMVDDNKVFISENTIYII